MQPADPWRPRSGAAEAVAANAEAPPEAVLLALAEAIGQQRISLALTHLSPDVCLLTPDATAVEGKEAVRAIIVQLVAMRQQIFPQVERTLFAGDVALAQGCWRGLSTGPDGAPFEQNWRASAVLRCIGGDWKLHLVVPWEARLMPGEGQLT